MNERLRRLIEGVPYTLDKEKLDFMEAYISGKGHATLLGEAGSGKTVVLELLKRYYQDEMVVFAATGVANQNLFNGKGGNGTAHSGLSIPMGMATSKDFKEVGSKCSNIFAGSDLVKHIVIDEAYMLNADNLKVILHRIARFNKKNAARKQRNIRLLLVGDCLQLPCIVDDQAKQYMYREYGHHLMFRSRVWADMKIKTYILQNVYRQGDKVFKAALNVLRFGEEDRYDGVLKWLNKRVQTRAPRDMFTVAAYNKQVDQVNGRILALSRGKKMRYDAEIQGKFDLKENGVEEHITLAEGLDYITTMNDMDGNFNNGSFCTVKSMTEEGAWCYFPHAKEEIFVPIHEYKEHETYVAKDVKQDDGSVKDELRRAEVGKCYQIPLKQCAAISAHRSQGKTFDKKGIVDLGTGFPEHNDFGEALLYVALSRFTDIKHVILPRSLKKSHIKVNRESIDFWNEVIANAS